MVMLLVVHLIIGHRRLRDVRNLSTTLRHWR